MDRDVVPVATAELIRPLRDLTPERTSHHHDANQVFDHRAVPAARAMPGRKSGRAGPDPPTHAPGYVASGTPCRQAHAPMQRPARPAPHPRGAWKAAE